MDVIVANVADHNRHLTMLSDHLWRAYPDLVEALDTNHCELSAPAIEMLAHIDGDHGYLDWHWIAMLENGRFVYLHGSSWYSGWDAASNLWAYEEETLELVLRHVDEAWREDLREQLPSRCR